MSTRECGQEFEILESVLAGRWPDGSPAELRMHAESCPVCSEALEVSLALHQDRNVGLLAARVPSSGLVWWRSEMRARRDAVRRATRPLRIVEWIALVFEVAAAIAILQWVGLPAFVDLWQPSLAFFLVIGAVVILTPIALYYVFSGD